MKSPILSILLICQGLWFQQAAAQISSIKETRIVLEHDGWQLVGDLLLPIAEHSVPAVLLLNQAAGNRTVYKMLANHLANKGIASLRLDLRGHGESTNAGRFVPGESQSRRFIGEADADVVFAHEYLLSHAAIDTDRIGIVGASYSGEEMAEAGRARGYARMYVALSPGSFSEESIMAIDSSEVSWLFITSKDDRFLQNIAAAVQEKSHTVELLIIPGEMHATDILEGRPDLVERIAAWLASGLQ